MILRGWFHNMLLLGFAASLSACAPATTKPTDAGKSTAGAGPSSTGPSSSGPKRTDSTVKESKTPTSLEALREGKTAESGPLKAIFFDFDRSDLRADARETLKANADWLKANPAARAEIEGHADERGTSEYNLALGAKRAQSAKDYLVTLGIAATRLSTMSYGEEVPVCR
ncbi:MAG: OmpA family protein, partial [Candidatus Binatia bacterium]